jgi:antitoxin component YwqK of YwqJK toxin-antitoxin module
MKHFWIFTCIGILSCQQQAEKNEALRDSKPISATAPEKSQNTTPTATEIKPGEYFEYHPNGEIKITGFHNNNLNREGLWISYYENGIKWSEAYYADGKRDGHSLTFYPNGKIRYIGEYKADTKTGEWTFYDEEGNVTKVENY